MEIIEKNIEELTQYIEGDPQLDDVKEKLGKKYPLLEEDKSSKIEALSKDPFLLAKIERGEKLNLLLLPELLPRKPRNRKIEYNFIQMELAKNLESENFSFNFTWKPGPEQINFYLAVPARDAESNLIQDILQESKNAIINSMPKAQASVFGGAHPISVAFSVYGKISPHVIWEFTWDLTPSKACNIYEHNFGDLYLSEEIPLVGNEEFVGFILLGCDEGIQKTLDDEKNIKQVRKKLERVEGQIKKSGFEIYRIMNEIESIPFYFNELLNMGLINYKSGQVKTIDRIVRDVSEITGEQVIRDGKFKNKKQIVDSLFRSFAWRINNMDYNIFKEYKAVEGVSTLISDYRITRKEMTKKKLWG
ncbi:hypothetical protein KAX97_13255 [candidate division WOR-3 bacterium]|nr:hypothetical protein [candidate division WOR-3 bacterium]